MKTDMYLAITTNGMIAKENDDTRFCSDRQWDSFMKTARRIRNVIVGRKTYEIMKDEGFTGLEELVIIAVSRRKAFKTNEARHFTARSPKEALKLLQKQGFREALVAGGGKLNTSFMKRGLIDEVYLDVEPTLLGRGINLFEGADFEANLKLIGTKKISPNEIQLHYKITKVKK